MPVDPEESSVPDERLRLIFTCCHPALSPEGRVALTLRTLGGLSTAEIAKAFLTAEPTMFQRITRAKNKIRLAGIPYQVPSSEQLPERTESVLAVVYLIFNEGYSTMHGQELTRVDLCQEGIHLAETLAELLPDEPDVLGLAALCWLTEGRRPSRIDEKGELVLLADQDRTRWNRQAIDRGLSFLRRAHRQHSNSTYVIQARIAALQSTAASDEVTDWPSIVTLYDRLLEGETVPGRSIESSSRGRDGRGRICRARSDGTARRGPRRLSTISRRPRRAVGQGRTSQGSSRWFSKGSRIPNQRCGKASPTEKTGRDGRGLAAKTGPIDHGNSHPDEPGDPSASQYP